MVTRTEREHPTGNCSYCLTRRVFMVTLPCQHQFCAECCLSVIKVTQLKKGLTLFDELNDNEEPLKCPKCGVVHIIGPVDKKMYAEVQGVEEVRQRLRKRVEATSLSQKPLSVASAKDRSKSKEINLATNMALCHICIPSSQKPAPPATWQCLTCQSTLFCDNCKAKHVNHPRR